MASSFMLVPEKREITSLRLSEVNIAVIKLFWNFKPENNKASYAKRKYCRS